MYVVSWGGHVRRISGNHYVVSYLDLVRRFLSWARSSSLGRSRLSFLVLITFVVSWGSHVRRLSFWARTWNVGRGCRYNVYFVMCPWYLTWRHVAFCLLCWIRCFIWLGTMHMCAGAGAGVCRCSVHVQVQVQLQVHALLSFVTIYWDFFSSFPSPLFGRGDYCMFRYVRCG